MKNLTGVMAVAVLAACGPAWQGKVSGYSLDQKEALYAILTDEKGASTGALIVLTDQTSLCPQLAVKSPPTNATVVSFAIERTVDGKTLAPSAAEYIVVNSGIQNGNTVRGLFTKTDSNGTSEISLVARTAASGMLKVSSLSNDTNTLSGTFDGKFGSQLDQVSTTFNATKCSISTEQLAGGFLGAASGNGGVVNPPNKYAGSCSTSGTCYEYVGSQYSATMVQDACRSTTSAYYSAGRCPVTGYGRCVMLRGQSTEYNFTYSSYSSYNESSCTQSGGVFESGS